MSQARGTSSLQGCLFSNIRHVCVWRKRAFLSNCILNTVTLRVLCLQVLFVTSQPRLVLDSCFAKGLLWASGLCLMVHLNCFHSYLTTASPVTGSDLSSAPQLAELRCATGSRLNHTSHLVSLPFLFKAKPPKESGQPQRVVCSNVRADCPFVK